MLISSAPFGVTRAGEAVTRYTIQNRNGVTVSVLNYGCTIQQILLPVRRKMMNVVLGYDTLEEYEAGNCYFGALIGRFANRISGGQVRLNGRSYALPKTDRGNYLHGSFHRKLHTADLMADGVVFRGFSPDGEDGFPGNLTYSVSVRLAEYNQLELTYDAVSDADTLVNLTNHTYFNLNGEGNILNHRLKLRAEQFTPVDAQTLPTGEIRSVSKSPMDFRRTKPIGKDIEAPDEQLRLCGGYDHSYILRGGRLPFAELESPQTYIKMVGTTTSPCVQLYTGNYVNQDTAPGLKYPPRAGLCLETQGWPDSPNRPEFPSAVLKAGQPYHQQTTWQFYLP